MIMMLTCDIFLALFGLFLCFGSFHHKEAVPKLTWEETTDQKLGWKDNIFLSCMFVEVNRTLLVIYVNKFTEVSYFLFFVCLLLFVI